MRSYLDAWALHHQPLGGMWPDRREMEAWRSALDGATPDRRRAVIAQNAQNWIGTHQDREDKNRATAMHARISNVWGTSAAEMSDRFDGLAAAESKKRASIQKFLDKLVGPEPLPEEILSYRPLVK